MDLADRLPPDLVYLAAEYPDWKFGAGWAGSASGPDYRYVYATRGGQELTAETAGALTALLATARIERG